jgi:hypothetical protein
MFGQGFAVSVLSLVCLLSIAASLPYKKSRR